MDMEVGQFFSLDAELPPGIDLDRVLNLADATARGQI